MNQSIDQPINQSINQCFLTWLKWHIAIMKSTAAQSNDDVGEWLLKEIMSLAVIETWREMVKTGGEQAMSSRRWMLQQETSDDRWVSDGGTSSWSVDDDCRRRRLGKSDIGTSWFKYSGAIPRSTRYAMSASLKLTQFHSAKNCYV